MQCVSKQWCNNNSNAYRPDNGRRTPQGVDNTRVAPYNPFLLLKYRTHINVEVVASISAVKYLYKYVYKGPDRTMAGLSAIPIPADAEDAAEQSGAVAEPEGEDELTEFQNCRKASFLPTKLCVLALL